MTLFDPGPSLAYPTNPPQRHASRDGFAARLAGALRYSNPYADRIDQLQAEGRRPGWLWSLFHAWDEGWQQADSLV